VVLLAGHPAKRFNIRGNAGGRGMTIYFTNKDRTTVSTYLDFVIKDNYMIIKINASGKTLYVPLYNVLYIRVD
jgi:hypothetical protein